jgi:glycerate dehydrogenase
MTPSAQNLAGVFLDLETVDPGDLDLSQLRGALPRWTLHPHTTPAEVAARIAEASVVVTNKVVLGRVELEAAAALRLICVAATGTDNVDLEAATERGIAVANVRGYATPAVVQHVFALILALTTRLPQYGDAVAAGAWQRARQFCLLDFPIRELQGHILGIVGYGELGRAVSRVAEAFGMEVLISERPGGPPAGGRVALDELLPRVDVLSLHCPLKENTRGLIGVRELELMPPDALLINTARGGLVDERALAQALRAGRLGGAGVDVLTLEPPTGGNPLLEPDIPNLIVTPHTAWASCEARQRLVGEVAANIEAWRAGRERNRVV